MLSATEIRHVYIAAEPDVVRQVPPYVIGIVVNNDVIAVPQPVRAQVILKRRDAEEETAKAKARWTSSFEPKDVTCAVAAGETSKLPWMVQVEPVIVSTEVVSDPLPVPMHVRRVWMPVVIREVRRSNV